MGIHPVVDITTVVEDEDHLTRVILGIHAAPVEAWAREAEEEYVRVHRAMIRLLLFRLAFRGPEAGHQYRLALKERKELPLPREQLSTERPRGERLRFNPLRLVKATAEQQGVDLIDLPCQHLHHLQNHHPLPDHLVHQAGQVPPAGLPVAAVHVHGNACS